MKLFWRYEICIENKQYPGTYDIVKRFWSERKSLDFRKQLSHRLEICLKDIIVLNRKDDYKLRKWRIHL